jgi:amino acid transporter
MEGFLICAGSVALLVVFLGFILLMRYIKYRETMLLAEKGLLEKSLTRPEPRRGGKATLVWGILIAAFGLALTLGLLPLGFSGLGSNYPLGLGPWMLFGFVPLFFGLALILIHVLTRNGDGKAEEVKPPAVEPQQELPKED